jgi:hypothetical protein
VSSITPQLEFSEISDWSQAFHVKTMPTEKLTLAGFTAEQVSALTDFLRESGVHTADLETKIDRLQAETRALALSVAEIQQRLSLSMRNEISAYLSARPRHFSRPQQPITFDVICVESADPTMLTHRDLFLDDETLDRHYAESSAKIGAVKANKAMRFVNEVSFRLCRRLAKRFADESRLPVDLLVETLFHVVWSELCRLIPARHLARKLARVAAGQPVLIPLTTTSFTYFTGRALEPFYLAATLQHCQVPVAFVCSDGNIIQAARAAGSMVFRFEPDKAIWALPRLPEPELPTRTGRAALVGAGIRGIAHILTLLDNPLKFQSSYVMDPAFTSPAQTILDPGHLPVVLNMAFGGQALTDRAAKTCIFLTATLPHGDLGAYLMNVLEGVIHAALVRTTEIVKRHQLSEAHICDHPFIESAILAHAVRANGGRVVLWPHGWGPAWRVFRRPPGSIAAIHCVDQPAASTWRSQLPGVPVTVISDLYLPRYRQPRGAAPSEPLTVVVIGNEYAYDRLPMIDRMPLEDLYRRLFKSLDSLAPEVQWICRPRSTANLHWQWNLADRSPGFRYATQSPMQVDYPNMVFLFPGQLSSALIEGIERGIPCVIVREDETIEDHLGFDIPPCVPMGGVAAILEEIAQCQDPIYRQELVDRQVSWCETQVRWRDADAQVGAG